MQLWEQGSKTENGSRCVVVKQRQSADLLLFKGMNRKRSSKSHKKPLGCFFLVVFKFLLASKPNKATLWCIAFEIMSCYNMAHITVHWLSHLLISVSQFPHLLSRVSLPVLQRKSWLNWKRKKKKPDNKLRAMTVYLFRNRNKYCPVPVLLLFTKNTVASVQLFVLFIFVHSLKWNTGKWMQWKPIRTADVWGRVIDSFTLYTSISHACIYGR